MFLGICNKEKKKKVPFLGHSCNVFTEKRIHLMSSVLVRPLDVEEYRKAGRMYDWKPGIS